MWLGLTLIAVVIVVIIVIVRGFRSPQQDRETEPSKEVVEAPPAVIPRVVYGEECNEGDLCIGGVSSARPVGRDAEQRAYYMGTSVTTSSHPFLIGQAGNIYVPLSSWWALSDTYGACLGFHEDSLFFLTGNGLYAVRPTSILLLSPPSTPRGYKITSIHRYGDSLYALANGSLLHLISGDEYRHTYTQGRGSEVVNLIPQSSRWEWSVVTHLRGRDIASLDIIRIDVVLYQDRETIYLKSNEGMMRYNHTMGWMSVKYVSRYSHHLQVRAGTVELRDSRGFAWRKARGLIYAFSNNLSNGEGEDQVPVLYTIDSDSWLWWCSDDTGSNPLRRSRGWSGLIQLEDSRLIAISTGETYVC